MTIYESEREIYQRQFQQQRVQEQIPQTHDRGHRTRPPGMRALGCRNSRAAGLRRHLVNAVAVEKVSDSGAATSPFGEYLVS
jgi:hypothetical protein